MDRREILNLVAPESEGWVHCGIGGMDVSYPPGYFDYLHTPEYKAQKAKEEADREALYESIYAGARRTILVYGTIAICLFAWLVARLAISL
jgi:hypothetical protein